MRHVSACVGTTEAERMSASRRYIVPSRWKVKWVGPENGDGPWRMDRKCGLQKLPKGARMTVLHAQVRRWHI